MQNARMGGDSMRAIKGVSDAQVIEQSQEEDSMI